MNRSRTLLILFVLLLFALWYAWQETPRQQRVAKQTAPRSSTAVVGSSDLSSTDASLNFSVGEANPYSKPKRDIFQLVYRAPVVAKKPVVQPKPVPVVVPPPPPPEPPPVAVRTVVKPIPPFKVLGFLQKDAVKTVFLSSPKGEIFLVKKGDRFTDDLYIRELSETQIIISSDQNEAGLTLLIGEKKMQRLAIPKISSDRPNVPAFSDPGGPTAKQVGD